MPSLLWAKMSRTRLQIVLLVLFKEKPALRVVLHTCVERLWSLNNFSAAFRAASSASLAYYQTHFFLFIYFYIAIAHSSIIKPVLDIYSDTGSKTSTRIRTPSKLQAFEYETHLQEFAHLMRVYSRELIITNMGK